MVFKSYWVGNKASLTGRVASGSCPPLALLGHCSCQVHLAQPFPQCALGLSRLSSAVRRLLVCSCPSAHVKLSTALILPQLLGNTTSMSSALPLLCRHQALLRKTAKTASCPLSCAFGHQWRDMANLIRYTSLSLQTLLCKRTPSVTEMPLKCITRVYVKKKKIDFLASPLVRIRLHPLCFTSGGALLCNSPAGNRRGLPLLLAWVTSFTPKWSVVLLCLCYFQSQAIICPWLLAK